MILYQQAVGAKSEFEESNDSARHLPETKKVIIGHCTFRSYVIPRNILEHLEEILIFDK